MPSISRRVPIQPVLTTAVKTERGDTAVPVAFTTYLVNASSDSNPPFSNLALDHRMSSTSSPRQYQQVQSSSSGGIAGDNSGDGTWEQEIEYQHQQYQLPSSAMCLLPMDSSSNYGEGPNRDSYFSDTTHLDNYTTLDEMFNPLSPLTDFNDTSDRTRSLATFEDRDHVPRININRTDSMSVLPMQNWSSSTTYLYPIQTDVQVQPSPAMSNTSLRSDSSAGFLSPRLADPVTPSPTVSQGIGFPTIMSSPESPLQQLGSLSPSTLGLSFMPSAGNSGKSNNMMNLMYRSSGPSSSTSEHSFFLPDMNGPPQTYGQHERSANSNSGPHYPQSRPSATSGSISAPPTPSTAPTEQLQDGTVKYTHAQQYQQWKDTPLTSPIASGHIRHFIPQRMYKPHTGSDRRRYVEQVPLSPPIIFEVEGPCEWGIDLDDAIKCRTKRLVDKDALMFEGCGPSVSIRLEWPGVPWSRQIPTKDFRSTPGPITKAKLAKNIAKCVQRFIKDNASKPISDEEDTNALRYKVGYGPHDVKLEDLVLVSLHHVSQGSWQPQLRLKRAIH